MLRSLLIATVLAGLMLGCATPPEDPQERADWRQVNDPLEPTNRALFAFNNALDRAVLRPLAVAYRDYLPEGLRRSVHNFLVNLDSPLVFGNDVLQAEGGRAVTTLSRTLINTTVGIGGSFDVAASIGLPYHDEDFGQTLAVWGVPDGPFLMLPLFGPSNPRDTVGLLPSFFADPLNLYLANIHLWYVFLIRDGIQVVDERVDYIEPLDALERTSLDFYATIRSVSRQHRLDQIRNKVPDGGLYGAAAPRQPR